ncbi:MAG: universal stress protein [Thermaerobacter sp.]|nr:universal stress protein [Thermaerobacter sp.]
MRILFATDASDGALSAARYVAKVFPLDAEITLVNVLRNPVEYFPDAAVAYNPDIWRQEGMKFSQGVFQTTREALGGRAVKEIFREGVPHQVLLDMSRDYDLVVVGKRRKPSLSRLVLGSVSQSLAHNLQVPLLIV